MRWRRISNAAVKRSKFVYTVFASKVTVQNIVVSTGALDEDNKGVSFASKVASRLQAHDHDKFQTVKVESVGKAVISESEPTIFIFDEPSQNEDKQDEPELDEDMTDKPETMESLVNNIQESKKDSKAGDDEAEQEHHNGLNDEARDVATDDQDDHHRKKEKHGPAPWFFVVGGVCGMAALALVIMYVGFNMATRRKKQRESIRRGTIVLEAEAIMPVSVVMPQNMGKAVAERRPTWSTTLEEVNNAPFAVVQHE